jgi:hypothetical protein
MKRFFIYLFFVPILFSACKRTGYKKTFSDPQLYSNTVHELNGVVMGNNFTPVVASRNYAYANIAAYEVIAAGYPKDYQSLVGQLNGFKSVAHPAKGKTINYELAAIFAFCNVGELVTFPAGSMKNYVDSLRRLAIDNGMPDEVLKNSENYANAVAKSIIKWSIGDNYLQTRTGVKYTIKDSAGRWVPTPPAYTDAVEPHWKELRYMVLKSPNQIKVDPPPSYNVKDTSSKYYHEVKMIENAGDHLTAEQTHIADFWDDNPGRLNLSGHLMYISKKFSPGGHWMSITGIGAKKVNANFNKTVCAYTKTAIALFDAFIQCWTIKYLYDYARPETAINANFDNRWRPHLQTPPFPEYTCGHCTISAAAAAALTNTLGDNVAYTDTSELEFGIRNRTFSSFRQAASETAISRFYGGIHFHNSCVVSTVYGTEVGKYVVDKLRMEK